MQLAPRRLFGSRLVVPVEHLEAPVDVLDQGGAALDPVPVVGVHETLDVAQLGVVDVAADDAVHAAPAGRSESRTGRDMRGSTGVGAPF